MVENKKDESETQEDAPPSLGLFGYSLPKTILLVILAGFVYEASQYGKGRLDQLARWIDGEESTLPIETPSIEEPTIPGVRVVKSDTVEIGSFQFSIQKEWLAVESVDLNYAYNIDPRYAGLLNTSLNGARDKSPFLLSTPKLYTVTLPSEAGHIFSLHQRVFFKASNEAKDVIAALNAMTEQQRKNISFVTGPGTLSPDQNAIVSGDIDKEMVSPDDVFETVFTNQLLQLSQIQKNDSPVSVKRTRITQSGSYKIAEVDYAYTLGQQHRLSAVLYWHYEEGTPWGDLGIFLVQLNEKSAAKNKRALKKTFSSLHLQAGDQKIWNDLSYDASTDTETMSFVHIDIDTQRLRSFGLNIKQVEEIVASSLPIARNDIGHIVVAAKNGHQVDLRDVAITQPLTNSGEQIQNFDSILLTVRP
ncbi:MAG: hypothetical protein FHK82_03605 [Sedimenticola thiotaurini]|uniref:Uncharacterized protein n=1 Tax=Sedimenticola thiotaurini TaxID=1543721 RepID=A0A558DCU5_9GAMM|nr:MAG: hypothetical protein FHK82_03605 [Sedimenticola thiotaurini]